MSNNNIVWVDFNTMESFIIDVFKELGVSEEDAKICANVLITADKRGINSHGIARLKTMYYNRIKSGLLSPKTNVEIVRESPTTAVVDGHNGMGQVIAKKSMDLAIEKADNYGLGMVAVKNSAHYGIAGYYSLMAIEANMIGITGTNSRPSVAPTFGVEPMLGTNPLTFGIPSDEKFPFLLDCSTSVTSNGKIEIYNSTGKSLPESWVIDNKGESILNSHQAIKNIHFPGGEAAILPLGGLGEENAGYKGYGYATVVEILSTALQGGQFLKTSTEEKDRNIGHFFIAINISAFIDIESFKKITGNILRSIRASKKAPGQSKIYTAGEKEYLIWLERKDKGVPLNEILQKKIIAIRDELELKNYNFLF